MLRPPRPPRATPPRASSSSPPPPRPLAVVGSINADLVARVARLPAPGETVTSPALATLPGGKGCNQAAAAGLLGWPTAMVGQVGGDGYGDMMLQALVGAGVDVACVRRAPSGVPTGTAIVLVDARGENCIVVCGGANTAPWPEEDADADAVIASAGLLLLQREVSDAVNTRAAAAAVAARVPVLLDAGGVDAPPPDALLSLVHTLSPNETELARLVGGGGGLREDDDAAVAAAASSLLARGPSRILVKRGARGAMLVTANAPPLLAPAFRVPRVVDTTGAGDCFTGAFAVAALRGLPAAAAMRYAAAAAALCVQREGALPSLPSAGEVEEFLLNEEG